MTEVGGVPSASCTAFLSNLHEWDDEVGVMYGVNNQPAKAILMPITGLINSSTVLKLIECEFIVRYFYCKYTMTFSVLKLDDSFKKLADIETPTCQSTILDIDNASSSQG